MSPDRSEQDGLGYAFLPAAGLHFLTPCFDVFSALLGFGRRFKARVVEAAGISDGMRVLDVGCGTGLTALLIKQRYPGCTVTGLDVDPKILKIARRRIARAGVGGVNLVCAPAENTGLDAASFDVVLSTLVFHHLPPQIKEDAAREIARLTRAGGTFLLVDLGPLTKRAPIVSETEVRSPRRAYRSNTAEGLRRAFTVAGFQVSDERPPYNVLYRPWLFALRATKLG